MASATCLLWLQRLQPLLAAVALVTLELSGMAGLAAAGVAAHDDHAAHLVGQRRSQRAGRIGVGGTMASLSLTSSRRGPLLAGLVLAIAAACAPPDTPPRADGVRRVLAHVRGIT